MSISTPLPAQLQSMIVGLLNPTDDVWVRQNYRDRLVDVVKQIETALRQFDADYKKSTVTQKPQRGKRKA